MANTAATAKTASGTDMREEEDEDGTWTKIQRSMAKTVVAKHTVTAVRPSGGQVVKRSPMVQRKTGTAESGVLAATAKGNAVMLQTAQALAADGTLVKTAYALTPKPAMTSEKPGSPGTSFASLVVGRSPVQVVAPWAVVDLVPAEKLALPTAPAFVGVSKVVMPLMESSMQVEEPSTPVVAKRSHDVLSPDDSLPLPETRAKEVILQDECGVLGVSPVSPASPATSTARLKGQWHQCN